MMRAISLLLVLFSAYSVAVEASPGFSLGNQFYASPVQGTVTVYCSPGEVVTYTCFDTVLDPSSYDYFIGPNGVTADQVSLTSTRADGSRRERTDEYDMGSTKSVSAFNLWISTLFQRPLLAFGTNKIDYKLISTGKIVSQGVFSVSVLHGTPRTCPATHYNSSDSNDCRSQYTVCQRYFEQYDYCR